MPSTNSAEHQAVTSPLRPAYALGCAHGLIEALGGRTSPEGERDAMWPKCACSRATQPLRTAWWSAPSEMLKCAFLAPGTP